MNTGGLKKTAPAEALPVIAQRLRNAKGGWALGQLLRVSGVSLGTQSNLKTGHSCGDVVTIARLEPALGVELWGLEHHAARIGAISTPPAPVVAGPTKNLIRAVDERDNAADLTASDAN